MKEVLSKHQLLEQELIEQNKFSQSWHAFGGTADHTVSLGFDLLTLAKKSLSSIVIVVVVVVDDDDVVVVSF